MKRYMTKFLALTGGLLMLGSLSGCQLDDPVIPAEELYIRGFIKKYGLIDPTQDFSSAVQTTITLDIPGKASVVNVYAMMGDGLYRVGCFAELQGTVSLPVDVSEATETIVVDVDGVRYYTTQNGHVEVKSGSSAVASRAAGDEHLISDTQLTDEKLKAMWINPAEFKAINKNGETEEAYALGVRKPIVIDENGKMSGGALTTVDGKNYFDVSKAAHIGAKLPGGEKKYTTDNNNANEIRNTAIGSNVTFLIENRDTTLSSYRFTFRTASKNDAEVRVVLLGQQQSVNDDTNAPNPGVYIFMNSENLKVEKKFGTLDNVDLNENEKYTEWEVVCPKMMPKGYYELIVIGVKATENVGLDMTCGNWGYMSMSRMKTATDMSWILACEDLGTTDDFDFNDVVFSIKAVNTNTAAIKLGVVQWQVVDNTGMWNKNTGEGGTFIHPVNAPASRDGDIPVNSDKKTMVKVTALASGGTLPIWLHFREEEGETGTGTDYIVCPGYDGKRGPLREVFKKDDANGTKEVADWISEEESNEKNGKECSEWHRWFGINDSKTMLNTGTYRHISETKSVTFYTNNVFSLKNFCYLKFMVTGDSEDNLPYYFHDTNLDPWSQKVLQWKWQQEHSQEVTFGFFLTVYKPVVTDSYDYIADKDPTANSTTVKNKNNNEAHLLSKSLEGLPPQMFLIPDCDPITDAGKTSAVKGWRWPCERVTITDIYPNFSNWVESATDYYGINWFMLPQKGLGNENVLFYPRDAASQNAYQPFNPFASGSSN